MTENILVCINGIVPIFLLILIGVFLRRIGMLDAHFCGKATTLIFKLVLPTAIFYDIASSDLAGNFDAGVVFTALVTTAVMFAAVWLLCVVLTKDGKKRAAFSQGAFRANYAILGLPLTKALFSGGAVDNATIILAASMVLFNVLAVVYLETFLNKEGGVKSTLRGIVTNPVIIGAVLGSAAYLVNLELPAVLDRTVKYISQISTPLSLIVIGASMRWENMKETLRLASFGAVFKTVITPLLLVPVALFLGIRGEALGVLFVFWASPSAVAGYAMTRDRGGDYDLSGNIIAMSTALSFFSILGGVLLLRMTGLI